MRPGVDSFGVWRSVDGCPELVRGGLIIVLIKKQFAQAKMGSEFPGSC